MSPLYPLVGTIGLLGRAVQDREQPSRRLPSLQFQRDPLEEIDALIGTTRPSRRMSLDTLLDLPEPRVDGARTPTPATPQPRAPRPTTPTAPSRAQAPAAPAFDPYEQIRRALEPDPETTTGPAPNARDIELPASGVPRTIGEVGRTTPSAYGRMADQLPDVSPTVLPTQPERFTTGRDPNIRPAAAEPLPFDDRPRMFGRQIPTVDFAPTLLPAKTVEEAAGMTPFKEGLRPVRPGETAEPPDRPTVVRDWVISGLKGLATVPEAAIGVADLALMGAAAAQPGTSTMPGGVVGRAADAVGFQPAEFKQYLDRFYTKEQQEAQRSVDEADGILETAVATLRNPRVIASTIIESLPLMAAGGVVGRTLAGAGTAPWLAGAIGEGSVAMGSAAEGIRQESGGVITPGQAALAGASGAGTALFGALGGKLAQRLGLPDVDTMLAAAAKDPVAARNVVAVTIGSAITEGFFEELPQSIQEQVLQNFATGKDPWDGVDQAAVLGFLSGAAMGGAVGAAHGARNIGRGGIDAQLTQAANAEQQVSKLLELRQNWQIERQARTGGRPGDQQLMAEADAVLAQIDRQLAALGYRRGTETQEPPLVQDPAAQTPAAARPGVEQPSGPGIPSPVPPPVDQSGAPASLAPQVVAELESRGFTPQEITGLSAEQAEGIIAADIRKTEQLGPDAVTPPRGTPIPDYVDPRDPPVSDQPTAATGEPTTMSAADTRAAMERVQEARDAARAEREEAANDPIEPIRQALGVAPPPEDNPDAKDAKKDLYGLIRTKQPTSGTELLAANDEYEKARAGGDPAAIPGNEPTPWPRAMSFDAQWGGWKAKTETVLPTPEWLASQGFVNRDKVEAIKEKFDDLEGDKPVIVRTAEGQVLILDGHHRLAAAMELEEPVDVRVYQEPAAAAAATDQTVTPEKPVEQDRYTPPKPVAEMDDDEFANHILALAQQEQQDKESTALDAEEELFRAEESRQAERKALAESLASSGEPVRFKNSRGWTALAGPDMSQPGRFRLTHFDANGEPWGHTEFPSQAEAILEALRDGYEPSQKPAYDREARAKEDADLRAMAQDIQSTTYSELMKSSPLKGKARKELDASVRAAADAGDLQTISDLLDRNGFEAEDRRDNLVGARVREDGEIELEFGIIPDPEPLSEDERAALAASAENVGTKTVDVSRSESWPHETMAPERILPVPEKRHKLPNMGTLDAAEKAQASGVEVLTLEDAQARIESWKAEAKRIGKEEDHSNEVILSLFDRTGSWSQPYKDAGYDVRTYDIETGDDLLMMLPTADIDEIKAEGKTIVGVLAAPPCTSFAVSGARWWKDQHDKADQQMVEKKYGYKASKYFDTPLEYAKALVDATKVIIELANPTQFHAVENPVGRIREQNQLPEPLLGFDPSNFGNPYSKRTFLWGAFNPNLPTANVAPTDGSYIHTLRGDDPEQKAERSITPEGFAYAFFMANHHAASVETAESETESATAPETKSEEPVAAAPIDYSRDAIRDAFSLTEAQAEAVDVLVQEMGLDTEQILVTKGGLPADGALRQDDFYARAKALYLERGAGNSPVRMAVALRDSGIRLPSRTAADRAAANRLVDRLIQEIERGGAPASASAPPPRARAGAAPSAIPSWPASERYPAPEDYLLALHAAVSSTPHGPRRTRLTAEIARVEAGDYSAPLLLETPDVLYQQPSEQPFYSRLQKAVEDAKQTRATGSQWKGIIRNAKIGQSADEYAFAHVDDLEDAKMYTRDEVLTYLKANEVQVVPVVLGSTGAAAQTAFTLELDDKEDGGEDDGGGWRNGSVTLDDGREFSLGGGWVDADDNFTPYQGDEVGYGLADLVRALGGDPDNRTDRRAVIETLQEASERAHFGGGSTRGDVSESAFWQGTRGSAQFASYQEPGADEGTYREVFLTAPPTDRGKPKPLTSLPDGYEPTIDQSQPEARRWSVIRPGQAHARPMGTRHATKEAALEEALRIVNSERMRAWFEARDDANWQDGHSQYKDIQNPIVRLRFNVRTADNRRTMFLEEIQPPAPSQPMPDIFRKNWRELGFKWALRYASENGLDAVAWTTGQMQADRYSLEKHVQAIEWEASRSAHSDGTPLKHVDILTRNTDLQPLLLVDEAGQIVQANDASFRGKKLEEVIGKELAKRIIEEPEGTIEEEGLRIGGEGLKRLYDKDLPAVVNKIPAVKRAGVKASITKLPIPSKKRIYEPITRAQAKADIERFGAVAVFIDMDDGPRSVRQVAVDLAQMAVREYPDDLGPMAKAVVRAGVPPAAWVDQHASAENVLSLLEEYGWDLGAKDALLRTVPEVAPAEVPAIEITPELRQAVLGGQPLFQGAKGAVEFSVDGKAVVRGLDGADISTAVHEIAHVARRQLINRNVPKDLRRGITDEDIESAEEWAGAKDGVWTVEAEEKFARGFEAYLREGKAPNSTLTKVFKALSDWLAAIYKKLKGSDIDVGLNVDIRDVFDQLVTRSRRAAGSKPKAASAPESDSPADRFTRLYTAALSEAVAKKPEDYGYGQEGVPRVVEKMRAALSQGSANTNSAALRKVAKDLGVKNNAREWKAFFAQEATAAAPAALKADAPTAKSGVLSIIIAGAPKRGKTPARADRRVDVPMEQVGRFAIHRALDDQSKGIDPKGDWVVAHIKTTARIIGVKNKGLARWIAEQLDALGGEKWDDLKGTDTTSVFTSTERAEIQSLLRRAPELYERAKRGGTAPQPEAPASVPSIIRSGTQGWTTSAPSDAVKGSQIFGGLRMPASVSRDPKVEIGSLGAIPTERGWVGTITAPDGTKVYSETAHELSAEASAAVADLAWREAWPVRSINGRLLDPTKDADEWDSRIKVLVEPGTPASELSDEKLRERAEKAVGELRVRARKELERRASAEQAEPATEPEQSEEPTAAGGIAVEYNRQRSAVQVTFAEKPDEDVRKGLKADGFRWGKGHWYKKATPAQAEKLVPLVRQSLGLTQEASTKADDEPDTWGHAATMSPGAAENWFGGFFDQGLEVRVRHRAHREEGWAYRRGDSSGIVWVKYDHSEAMGVSAQNLEPGWRAGDVVTRGVATDMADDADNGEETPAIDAAVASGLRRQLTHLNNLLRGKLSQEKYDEIAGKIREIEATLMKVDGLPDGYTLVDSGQKNLPSPDAASHFGNKPARGTSDGPALSPKQQAIEDEKAKLKAEAAEIVAQMKAKLTGQVNMGLDPDLARLAVKLIRNYVRQGVLELRGAVARLREDYGEGAAAADRYVELAWRELRGQDLKVADIRRIDVKPAGLSGEAAAVQARAIEALQADPDGFKRRYLERFGRVLNADNASELFDEYAASDETRATQGVAVRAAAGALIDSLYQDLLAMPVEEGREPIVVFTAGGNAAGKSTAIPNEPSADIVFDSTFSSYEPSKVNVDRAFASGRDIRIRYTYRDPMAALQSSLDRALGEAHGRTVTVRGLAATHIGSRDSVLRVADAFRGDPRVQVVVRENTPGGLVARDLNWLREQAYDDRHVLEERLFDALDAARPSLPEAVYVGTRGIGRRRPEDRRGDGRRVQAERTEEPGDSGAPESGAVGAGDGRSERDLPERGDAGAGIAGAPVGGAGDTGLVGLAGEQPVAQEGAPGEPDTGRGGRPAGGRRSTRTRGAAQGGRTGTARGGRVHPPGSVEAAGGSDDVAAAESRGQAPLHFTIHDASDLTEAGWTAKLDANMAALRLLKALQKEARMATADEQKILARYIGWGHTELATIVGPDAGRITDPRKMQARQELEKLLTPAEMRELHESTANAHYSFNDLPRAMWGLVQKLGFKGGTILEPAVGIGHFFGTMPGAILANKRTRLFGVDKEPIASAIAKQLYQGARIQNSPLQDATLPDNYFDLVISNVPFGRIKVFDRNFVSGVKDLLSRSIHNYYFGKAIDVARPGGLIVFVTSRYTMDSRSDTVRKYLSEHADFLGAIRLPDASFKKTAGTEVVTDVIVLRKKGGPEGQAAAPALDWIASQEKEITWKEHDRYLEREYDRRATFEINEYFIKHPKQVLGEQRGDGSMQRTNEPQYNVKGEVTLKHLEKAFDRLKLADNTIVQSKAPDRKIATEKPPDSKQGTFVLEKGQIFLYDNGTLIPSGLKGKSLERAKLYVPVRDAYQKVLDVMVAHGSDEELATAQAALRKTYNAFVKSFGHVSTRENTRIIEMDPNGSRVLALEETAIQKVRQGNRTITQITVTGLAPIMGELKDGKWVVKRTVQPVVEPTSAESPRDALVQSLAWKGAVDLEYMSALTGTPVESLIQSLKGEIFKDPETQAYLSKDEYLSGDVVTKLANAEAAGDEYAENATELKRVQPVPLGPDEFSAPFGSTWVPIELYQQFLNEEGKGQFGVRLTNTEQRTTFYVDGHGRFEFAPAGADVSNWVENALNGKLPTIKSKVPGRGEAVDPALTEQYRQSLSQLREAWDTWWRSNVEAADKLVAIYNGMFNREAARQFDGSHVVIPNASPEIKLRPWQKNVIWRALQAGNTLLAHAVGAGKTYAMIGISGEMKRLGLARKPMIVVPNHLVEQWRRDYLRMYPDAKVLIPTKRDFEKANRQKLLARIANNDWDVVILAATQFLRISVKPETLKAYVDEQVQQLLLDGAEQLNVSTEEFDELVEGYDAGDKHAKAAISGRGVPRTVKDIARQILNLKARLQKRLDQQKKDAPISFEQTGVDALLIDEAHLFKNLFFSTSRNNIAGLRGSDSQRAQDMYLKVRLINEASGGRNVHFATGTPVSNAMSELYTMFRYLAQPALARLGMGGFDAWANAYAVARGEMEPTADGKYKERIRLRDWANLRELSKLFRRFTDVILPEDLIRSGVLKLPKLKGGRPTTIAVEPHPAMQAFMAHIADRVEALKSGKVDPRHDNHLKISSEASLAAIDMRLVNPGAEDYEGSRIRRAAEEIAKRYRASQETLGTQLVFLDVGTPKTVDPLPGLSATSSASAADDVDQDADDDAEGDLVDEQKEAEEAMAFIRGIGADRNLYAELKKLLVQEHGIPADEIAFIHQAKDASDQGRLFQMVRDGKVRVLMASTEKGGTGMNIQDRLVALHHLDVPWRPADMEQREGRILRQGNQNAEVEVLRYVTRGSFDEYRWGLLATKQGFIYQFMRGEISTMDDSDPAQLDMQVAQALASGDPRVLQMLNLEREVKGLRARYTNYERKRGALRQEVAWAERSIELNERRIEKAKPLAEQAEAWGKDPKVEVRVRPGRFGLEVAPAKVFDWEDKDSRKAFNEAIVQVMTAAAERGDRGNMLVAQAGPFQVMLQAVDKQVAEQDESKPTGYGYRKETAHVLSVMVGAIESYGGRYTVPQETAIIIGTTREFDPKHPPDYRRSLDHYLDPDLFSRLIREARATIEARQRDRAEAQASLDKPFKQLEELKAKEEELKAVKLAVGTEKAVAAAGQDDDAPSGGAPSGEASAGMFAEGDEPTTAELRTVRLRPIEFPELVELARTLMNTPQVVKRFRGSMDTLGRFQPGMIRIRGDLFKKGQERQLAATLAHEIGHLVDWLPDYTLKRGNILGRLRTLHGFLKWKYTGKDGVTVHRDEIRGELLALSEKWRPWDKNKASERFRAYRVSSKELYADAISVLLNDPGMLEREAPIFFQEFFSELDAKPDVKAAYFGLQEVLSGTRDELIARRRGGVRGMFEEGDAKAIELERLRRAQKDLEKQDFRIRFKTQFIDKHTPIIERVLETEKASGRRINPDDNPVYWLEERNYMGGRMKAWMEKHIQPVYQALNEARIDWHTFGEALFYDRIIAGDRSEIANPRGLSAANAEELRLAMLEGLSNGQQAVLTKAVSDFRAAIREIADDAYQSGLYTDELYDQMVKNPAYATFQVIEHLDTGVSSRVFKQIGTLKDVTNPADATILKTLVTMRAVEHQRAKVKTFDFLHRHHPADIEQAKEIGSPKGRRPIEPERGDKRRLVTYFEKGKLRGKYVDPYIADSLENLSVGQNNAVIAVLRAINSRVFRPLFTTYNLGFQTFNISRDFWRFWKNQPTMTLARALQRYWEAIPMAKVRAFGLANEDISALRKAARALTGKPTTAPTAKEIQGYKDLIEAEHAQILSITFNDASKGRDVEETQIEDILVRSGVGGFRKPARHPLLRPIVSVLDAIEKAGNLVETLPKAAGIYEFKGKGAIADIPADRRSFIRRKLGSPDFLSGGTYKPYTNEIFLFSNAITQAWRADLEVATQPETRAGFWWKTAALNIVPKLLMFAAAYGLWPGDDDDDLQEIMRKATEYDLTNYIVVPLGTDSRNHAVYLRIPTDDTGRVIGGLLWKLLRAGAGERDVMETAMQVVDYSAGQFPSPAPTLQAIGNTVAFASGRNPYDAFRGRFLFTDDELKARDGRTVRKFLGWEFQQLGGGTVWKFYPGEAAPREQSVGQTIVEAPMVSNIIGRWVRVTSYGEVERLRQVQGEVQRDEARQRLTERDAINAAVREYQDLPSNQQNRGMQRRLSQQIARELYSNNPKERRDREDKIFKKLSLSVVRGKADPMADAIIGATSNDQKVQMILDMKDSMDRTAFERWLLTAVQNKVISPEVRARVRREQRK